ncbi:MAG: hypothetical protein OEN56_10225 [Gemmatimonadota bacterium]|nr:hypothetical protein [Gemmatimonadota bacterium]
MTRFAVAGLLSLAGCAGECCFIDHTSAAVLEGRVTDATGAVVAAAALSPAGVLRYDCAVATNPMHAEPSPSITGADGRFRLTLTSADGPGTHCFDIQVIRPGTSADTVRDVRAEFRLTSEPAEAVTILDIVLDL